jgi:hypothetical protein
MASRSEFKSNTPTAACSVVIPNGSRKLASSASSFACQSASTGVS